MAKAKTVKTTKAEGLQGTAIPELIDETKQPLIDKSLTDEFKDFENTISSFTPEHDENEPDPEQINNGTEPKEEDDPILKQLKLKMLTGLICTILVGANNLIFNMIKGTKVPYKEMELDETEKESLMPYLDSPEILAFLDKIPTWLMGVIHFEYMMFQKHSDLAEQFRVPKELKIDKDENKTG